MLAHMRNFLVSFVLLQSAVTGRVHYCNAIANPISPSARYTFSQTDMFGNH